MHPVMNHLFFFERESGSLACTRMVLSKIMFIRWFVSMCSWLQYALFPNRPYQFVWLLCKPRRRYLPVQLTNEAAGALVPGNSNPLASTHQQELTISLSHCTSSKPPCLLHRGIRTDLVSTPRALARLDAAILKVWQPETSFSKWVFEVSQYCHFLVFIAKPQNLNHKLL